ncbi:MAG: hypothetical protein MSH49_05725 [[Eubacterium] saphenum]|nr:hypothetical protein [[Eubacterium] saphenum]
MSKKNRKNRAEEIKQEFQKPEETQSFRREEKKKTSENVLDELFGELGAQTEIEDDIADLGTEEDDGTIVAENPVKHRFFFGFAIFVVIMAIIGMVASVRFVVNGIGSLMDNTSLKEEFTGFILPVVANDIAPFSNEGEISHSAKVGCAVWNILLNKDISAYKKTADGELIIPEYDVGVSCKELFGTNSEIIHQSTGTADTRFIYSEQNHIYTCTYNMRYLSYAPGIAKMEQNGGVFTLTVEYYPPSISVVSQNIGIQSEPEKTMTYTIWRDNGKNTLMSVKEIEKQTE